MKGKLRPHWSVAVVALLAALTIGLCGPHRAVVGDGAIGGVDLAGYVLPDGSLPLLCVFDSGDERDNDAGGLSCMVCLLGSHLWAPPSILTHVHGPFAGPAAAPWPARGPPSAGRHAASPPPPRAPPAV